MIYEIRIHPTDRNSDKRGKCFERLVRRVIEAHRYKIASNVNFTGMEVDLIAKHQDRVDETLYVECKAKEKVSSIEIRTFAFNVNHKNADYGYFIRTQELEHQAAGLVEEMKSDIRYKNLFFFDPEKVMEILEDGKWIKSLDLSNDQITKKYLVVADQGDYLVMLSATSLGSISSHYYVVNAKSGEDVEDIEILKMLEEAIPECKSLKQMPMPMPDGQSQEQIRQHSTPAIEAISEVQSSEKWYDYLPASSEHFVGRTEVRTNVMRFFKDVSEGRTSRRLFYLTGKSGWGKSSLISELRGRTRNKHYKNRFFTLAVDARSATSSTFPALAFEKLIVEARKSKFLRDEHGQSLKFSSTHDILSSESVRSILKDLQERSKFLILIFDQFEDVFRKEGFFQPFYKLLSDITDHQGNIIVGFSWKSEILIPTDNKAYHLWQQAKEQAICFEMPAFGAPEINGVIRQLELDVPTRSLPKEVKRRITESSQSLPWLTKKLCIHIYKQVVNGAKLDDIYEENLNIESLFKADLEQISGDELATLRYVATCGRDGKFLDVSQLGKDVESGIVDSLRDKRLIVRSGITYTVYWDVFRDYLITGEIPVLGESYLFRQGANACCEIFLSFQEVEEKLTMRQIKDRYSRHVNDTSLANIVLELRNLGVLLKEGDTFRVDPSFSRCDRASFVAFVTDKLERNTACSRLSELGLNEISISDVRGVLEGLFQAYEFKERTWNSYVQNLMSWIFLSELDLKEKLIRPRKGRRGSSGSRVKEPGAPPIRISSSSALEILNAASSGAKIEGRRKDDLVRLRLLDVDGSLKNEGERILKSKKPLQELCKFAIQLPRILEAHEASKSIKKLSATTLLAALPTDYFAASKQSSKINYSTVLCSWLRPLRQE